jgi:hypothetical protein
VAKSITEPPATIDEEDSVAVIVGLTMLTVRISVEGPAVPQVVVTPLLLPSVSAKTAFQ